MRVRGGPNAAVKRNRIALYFGTRRNAVTASSLRPYFESAQSSGLRIVTVASEARRGVQRPVFKRLVARMEAGEFEAIMTVVDADVKPSDLPRPTARGDAWILHRREARS